MKYAGMVVAVLLVLVMTGVDAIAQSRVRGFPSYGVVSVTRPGVTPRDNRVYGQLEETLISFTFNDQPLGEAIDFLRTIGNVNIVLDRGKVDRDRTLTLKLKDVSLRSALDFVTEQAGLKWVVKGGVVFISDEDGTTQEPVTVVYDVMPLLAVPPDFEGPEIGLDLMNQNASSSQKDTDGGIDWGEEKKEKEKDKEKTREELMDELVKLIREVIAPGTWDTGD